MDRSGSTTLLLYRLGVAYEDSGKPGLAAAAWLRATTLGTGAAVKNPYYRLALSYDRAKKPDESKKATARALFGEGREFVTTGQPAMAVSVLREATRNDPQLRAAWFYLGEANRLLGHKEAATTAYKKCLDLDPYHDRARRGLLLLELPR